MLTGMERVGQFHDREYQSARSVDKIKGHSRINPGFCFEQVGRMVVSLPELEDAGGMREG